MLLFGWTRFWRWRVIFQSASRHLREKGGNGLESALDLFGCIPDADGYDGFGLSDPVFDSCGLVISQTVVSGQVEDVAIGSQHFAAGVVKFVDACLQSVPSDCLVLDRSVAMLV